jgi:hypothetical protein
MRITVEIRPFHVDVPPELLDDRVPSPSSE